MAATSVRRILAEQHGGISRAGLLAWCRLRIDPGMTEEQLAAELEGLGPDLIDDSGFLRLRPGASADEPARPTPDGPPEQSVWAAPVAGSSAGGSTAAGSTAGPAAPVTHPAAPTTHAAPWTPPTMGQSGAPAASGGGPAGQPVPGWSSGTPAVPSADAGRPFDWIPPNLDRGPSTPPEGTVPGWEAPKPGMSSRSRTLLIAGGMVAVIAFVVLSSALSERPLGAPSSMLPGGSGLVPGATMIGAFDLTVGDCVMEPQSEFDSIESRPCTMAHQAEVFFIGDVPEPADGRFPSEDAFDAFMEQQCLPAFQDYTGSVYASQAQLDVSWFAPTEESWANGDREVVCLIVPGNGGTTDRSWRQANP